MTPVAPTLLAALIALSGCMGSEDDGGLTPVDLIDREFVSTSVTEKGEPRPLEPGTEISLSFEREKESDTLTLIWDAGCNSAGGPVEISDDQLVIEGKRIATTLIGCERALMAQDAWLWEFFDADPEWTLTDLELTLASGETTIVLGALR